MAEIQATPENTKIGDYVVQTYRNDAGELHPPFYSKIVGTNTKSWKVISVDAFGNETTPNVITQIKRSDGSKNIVKITSVWFSNDRRNKPNYISWKFVPFPGGGARAARDRGQDDKDDNDKDDDKDDEEDTTDAGAWVGWEEEEQDEE